MAKQARTARRTVGPRKVKRQISTGQVHVFASFNNTIVTISDKQGNTICWASSGSAGFKGSRKSTPFAARIAAERAAQDSITNDGMREVDVFVSGAGPGREASLRAIAAVGLRVRSIVDSTPIPHNGCRPAKRRRI